MPSSSSSVKALAGTCERLACKELSGAVYCQVRACRASINDDAGIQGLARSRVYVCVCCVMCVFVCQCVSGVCGVCDVCVCVCVYVCVVCVMCDV